MHKYYIPLYFIKFMIRSKGFLISIILCLITQISLAEDYKINEYNEYDLDYNYSFLNFYNPEMHESPSNDNIKLSTNIDNKDQKTEQKILNLSQDLNQTSTQTNTENLDSTTDNNYQSNLLSSISGINLAKKIKTIDFNLNNLTLKNSINQEQEQEQNQNDDFNSDDKTKLSNTPLLDAISRNTKPIAGFLQKGIASWYGKAFHGKKTASGDKFNMYAYTAAHRTLPLGSYVKVTNPSNNKTAIVKITDRGPYAHSRVIDLSFAAAKSLDMLGRGTANVQLEKVE